MKIPVELDRDSAQPLMNQLAEQLRAAIRQGRIPAGARLPSSRALAEQLGLSRNTVVRAYETLSIEGVIEARTAHGFFASRDPQALSLRPRTAKPGPDSAPLCPHPPPKPGSIPTAPRLAGGGHRTPYDFAPARPSVELFPVKSWRRLLQGVLSYGGGAGLSEQGDPAGSHALRAAIAAHISLSRGIVADPAQILVVGGVQEGLSLTARLLVRAESRVVIEDPGYQNARLAFEAAGARILPVRVDEEGLLTARLPELGAALVYVTPAHQFPTGHTLSPQRRGELVAWARRHGCYIVEDDYDSEFQYEGSPLQALAGMAPDCVIHLGTFSTTLGAGLRLGYVVVPLPLVELFHAGKGTLDRGNAWLDQAVLAEFMRSGGYAAHVARCRGLYRESRDALLSGLKRHFGSVALSGEAVGLHVLWRLPAGVPEAARLEGLAQRQRVGVYSLASAGAYESSPSAFSRRSLLLGFACLVPHQIEQGIARLSDAIDDTLDDHHDFLGELLLDQPPPEVLGAGAPSRKAGRRPHKQQPAIRTVSFARQRRGATREDKTAMRVVRGIYRYPVKGLSPQALRGVTLQADRPFPFDRVFALSRPGVPVDVAAPRWAKKGLFLMLMLDESLAQVQTHLDVDTLQLEINLPAKQAGESATNLLRADLTTPAGRQQVEAFFQRHVPNLKEPPRLLRALEGHFMDKPDSVMSCINLATLRALEAEWGTPVHPLRFRANFYIDGVAPWAEFDWIGSDIMLGDVLFRVDRRNGRCGATNVNPVTGARDLDIPGSLRKRYGHKDLGIYLVARTGGKVVVGDEVSVPELGPSGTSAATPSAPARGHGKFICRGCYYVYEPSKGASGAGPGTPFAELAELWRCPDCGTDKSAFRPFASELTETEAG